MGLFDVFKKKEEAPAVAEPQVPAAVEAASGDDVLCAPVAGRVIAMADTPDPVFSGEVLGKGCSILPEEETVYAPLSGTVIVTMGHAVGIMGDTGIEVLVHVGIDTVSMEGKGFTGYVKQGDKVVAGQPVITMDRAAIKEAGFADCVVLAVSNTPEFASVDLAVEPEAQVAAGEAVIRVTR
ncbi:PTS glucose transporter subunit IIA [Collinsella sp. AGMB00827]|uniref:PTS glucose transporter subunit IIA n=1 Tax=Collinsella ureilytica TaxID=2869515 RepID=A0ABS7MJH3_9ACTN|nr:PTS glucose transporter subunit IIA [Collinsella urealyticum]MBY4797519.1 PTS glucose transporter subunit IIA [Collinsella urealyticum]